MISKQKGFLQILTIISIAILAIIITIFTNTFSSITSSNLFQKMPLVFERKQFILKLNDLATAGTPNLSKSYSIQSTSTAPISLSFPYKHASIIDCGDAESNVFYIRTRSYNPDDDSEIYNGKSFYYPAVDLSQLFTSDAKKVNIGNNEYVELDPRNYLLFASTTILQIKFPTEVCLGKYDLSPDAITSVLSNLAVDTKDQSSPQYSIYKDFVDKKLSNEIETPTQCFTYTAKLKNEPLTKTCEEYTEKIYKSVLTKLSDANYKNQIHDSASCKEFIKDWSKTEQDVAMSEFDYKGTQSICNSVSTWKQ